MALLEEEVVRWVDESRSILVSTKRVVEYFGNDDEYESLLLSLVLSEAFLDGVIPAFKDPQWRASATCARTSGFMCRRELATMITPLLQILVEPVPEFVPLARRELVQSHFASLMRHVGGFTGSIAVDLCKPIWQAFADLAPEGWPALGAGPPEGA